MKNLFSKLLFYIVLQINGKCSTSNTGVITGNISPQTETYNAASGCIFLSGNKEVAPVQKNGDQNQYDSKTKIFTFTRTKTTRSGDNGRAEMNFCFTKPTTASYKKLNDYQKKYLAYTKQVYHYCENAVHDASVKTDGTYTMEINIPKDTGTATAKSVIAQWHGRPRRLVYKEKNGAIKELSNPLSSIKDDASLKTAKDDYDDVKTAGGKFNQGGYPPLTVKIASNKLAIVARYDNRKYNDKSARCNLNEAKYAVGTTKKCVDKATDKMYVTIIYREDLTNWTDQWKTLKLVVNWEPLGTNSRIRVYVGNKLAKDWSGLLGRNDKYGPYMKYGIYAPGKSKDFKVKIKNASSDVTNSK